MFWFSVWRFCHILDTWLRRWRSQCTSCGGRTAGTGRWCRWFHTAYTGPCPTAAGALPPLPRPWTLKQTKPYCRTIRVAHTHLIELESFIRRVTLPRGRSWSQQEPHRLIHTQDYIYRLKRVNTLGLRGYKADTSRKFEEIPESETRFSRV